MFYRNKREAVRVKKDQTKRDVIKNDMRFGVCKWVGCERSIYVEVED